MARTNYSYAKRQREKAKKKKKEEKRLKKLGKRNDQTTDEDAPADSGEADADKAE
ncbi:MAG: hypothetical protein HKN37_13675 [Rhodothermales bacterium]|nr:hypothetical protein [Rhodothermales bacterium]